MGNTSITSPKGSALRDEVLRALSLSKQPLTVRQLYEESEIAINTKDISSIMKPLIEAGDVTTGELVSPGEQGGMTLSRGAKPVASYRLAQEFRATHHSPETTTAEVDPLIMQLAAFDTLSRKPEFEQRDVGLLRGMATTNLISTEMPDWSLYLLGLADRIEESL